MLSNIEMICKLMEPDLNPQQMGKLRNVLEIILKRIVHKTPIKSNVVTS